MMSKDARRLGLLVCLLSPLFAGASFRTPNFIVSAETPRMAREVGAAAERQRRELAVLWLGEELPQWRQPCPIRVEVGDRIPPNGRTSFRFGGSEPFDWDMLVCGSWERVLDSVLPHEITHTIFATHFRRPLPRWADEGACTTIEHREEKAKHQMWLIRYLQEDRGIAFAQLFAMTDYPEDMLPLYAQGFSLCRFLIEQRGRRVFIKFLEQGMASNEWRAAVRDSYGYASLGALQNKWLNWVQQGSPVLVERTEDSSKLAEAQDQIARASSPGYVYRGQDVPLENREEMASASLANADANVNANGGGLATIVRAPKYEDAPETPSSAESPYASGSVEPESSERSDSEGSYYAMIASRGSAPDDKPISRSQGGSSSTPRKNIPGASALREGIAQSGERRVLLEWSKEKADGRGKPMAIASMPSDLQVR